MDQWLQDIIADLAATVPAWHDMTYSSQRRMVINVRWPQAAQNEATQDHLNGRTAEDGGKWELMQSELAAIKTAFPKPTAA